MKKSFAILAVLLACSFGTQAQTASFTKSATTLPVGQMLLVDGHASTGYVRHPQDNGSPSVIWSFGDGTGMEVIAGGHAYRSPGTYPVSLQVKNASGAASAVVTQTVTVVARPTVTGGNIVTVSNQGSISANTTHFGARLTEAKNLATTTGLDVEVRVPSNFQHELDSLPSRPSGETNWINIVWTGLSVPEGQRMTPAGAVGMPYFVATGLGKRMDIQPGTAPAHHYRFIGMGWKKQSDSQTDTYTLLWLGGARSGGDQQSVSSHAPHDFEFDRCFLDGGGTLSDTVRGIELNAHNVTVKNSRLSGFKSTAGDAQAILILSSMGNISIDNNYLEGSGENILIGGGDTSIRQTATVSNPSTTGCTLSTTTDLQPHQFVSFTSGGNRSVGMAAEIATINTSTGAVTFKNTLTASPDTGANARWASDARNIEIRRNFVPKQITWKVNDPSYNVGGTRWVVKNGIELKRGRFVVLEGNIIKDVWASQQEGAAFALTPVNQDGQDPTAAITDIYVVNNIVNRAPQFFSVFGTSGSNGSSYVQTRYVTFRNNLAANLDRTFNDGGPGQGSSWTPKLIYPGGGYSGTPPDYVSLINNTIRQAVRPGNFERLLIMESGTQMTNARLINNNLEGQLWITYETTNSLKISASMPGGVVKKNWWGFELFSHHNGYENAAPDNYYQSSFPAYDAAFANPAGGNFTVTSTSANNGGTDGKDTGPDMTTLGAATAGTESGIWSAPALPYTLCTWAAFPACTE